MEEQELQTTIKILKMKKTIVLVASLVLAVLFSSCQEKVKKEEDKLIEESATNAMEIDDGRISLNLNPMQKNHQLSNMRSHLEAIQEIVVLLSEENYDDASDLAYMKLGSTTEMKMMCASFGDKGFENLGLEFHKSADKMSEIFKQRNKNKSLEALSNTMNYCVQCHATYKQ